MGIRRGNKVKERILARVTIVSVSDKNVTFKISVASPEGEFETSMFNGIAGDTIDITGKYTFDNKIERTK